MWYRNEFNDFLSQQMKVYLIFKFYIRLKMQLALVNGVVWRFAGYFGDSNFVKGFVCFFLLCSDPRMYTHLDYYIRKRKNMPYKLLYSFSFLICNLTPLILSMKIPQSNQFTYFLSFKYALRFPSPLISLWEFWTGNTFVPVYLHLSHVSLPSISLPSQKLFHSFLTLTHYDIALISVPKISYGHSKAHHWHTCSHTLWWGACGLSDYAGGGGASVVRGR